MNAIPEKLITKLKALARERAWTDPDDYAKVKLDDSFDFDGGATDEEIMLAREILEAVGIKWS